MYQRDVHLNVKAAAHKETTSLGDFDSNTQFRVKLKSTPYRFAKLIRSNASRLTRFVPERRPNLEILRRYRSRISSSCKSTATIERFAMYVESSTVVVIVVVEVIVMTIRISDYSYSSNDY